MMAEQDPQNDDDSWDDDDDEHYAEIVAEAAAAEKDGLKPAAISEGIVDYSYSYGKIPSQRTVPCAVMETERPVSAASSGCSGSTMSTEYSVAGTDASLKKDKIKYGTSKMMSSGNKVQPVGSCSADRHNVHFRAAQFHSKLRTAHLTGAGGAAAKYKLDKMKVTKGAFGDTSDFGLVDGGSYNDLLCCLLFAVVTAVTALLFAVGVGDIFASDPPPFVTEPTCTVVCVNGGTCVVEDNYCECQVGFFGDTCQQSWGAEYTVNATNGTDGGSTPPPPPSKEWTNAMEQTLIFIMLVSCVVGMLCGIGWVLLALKFAELIYGLLVGMVVGQLALGAALLSSGIGILCFISAALTVLAFVLARAWIPFAIVMLRASVKVLDAFPRLLLVRSRPLLFLTCSKPCGEQICVGAS
eukprot:SAG31_NODE_3500_length_4192_cov_2.220621_4_plen_410_part_00